MPHVRMRDDDEDQDDEHVEIEMHEANEIDTANPGSPTTIASRGTVTQSVSALNRANIIEQRWKIVAVAVSVLCFIGVVAIAASHGGSASTSMATNAASTNSVDHGGTGIYSTSASSTMEVVEDEDLGDNSETGFLKLNLHRGNAAVFALSKDLWNASFVVYPTVVKHAAPQMAGLERGSVLLDTTDHVFHFEMSSDESFLVLVQDFNHAVLSKKAEEMKAVFDESQWPGFVIRVPIYIETEEAYYFPSDPFLGSGFFVSAFLAMASDYRPVEDGSSSYPRNSMFQIEYETLYGTVIVNYAIGVLPETVMSERVADDRVGYFSMQYTRYGEDQQDNVNANKGFHYYNPHIAVVNRRRLEADPISGVTKEPITFYVDPSVPAHWREAFRTGVESWKPAFERIGFVDAIRAVLPDDPDWPTDYRLGDLRYNSISVMISDMTYALAPHVIDPRSGEILHSDIVFEYGFFNEIMADFDVFSPVDPPATATTDADTHAAVHGIKRRSAKSRTGQLFQCGLAHDHAHITDRFMIGMLAGTAEGYVPDEIVAQHLADIIMHEVGHTLGLRHNFAASSSVTREQLNDDEFVRKNGVATSVMDYVPANIYSDLTPEAAATHGFYTTTIGSYDYAAIAYGYSIVPDEVPGEKCEGLTALARSAPVFLTDEAVDMMTNPFAQRYDLSSDPVDYAADRLAFVLRARNTTWLIDKVPDDAPASTLWRRERALLLMLNQSIQIVQPVLGGANVTNAHHQRGQAPYKAPYISSETQQRALDVLTRIIRADDGLFPSPEDYATFVDEAPYDFEDCREPSLDYSCLGRGLVDVDAAVLAVRRHAVTAALFPALDRIVAQDIASPLNVTSVLSEVKTAAASNLDQPRNKAVFTFFYDSLQSIVDQPDADVRVKTVIQSLFPQITPAPLVRTPPEQHFR